MADEEDDDLKERFPEMPPLPDLPEAPKLAPILPPHPSKPQPGAVAPGSYNKMAIGATAASSFITPIIVLSVGGYLLDQKLHSSPWMAFLGVVVGFVVGLVALLNVMKKLSD